MEAHKRAKLEKKRQAARGTRSPTTPPAKITLEMRKSILEEASNLEAAFDAVSGGELLLESPKSEPGRDEFLSVVLIDQLSRAGTRVNELRLSATDERLHRLGIIVVVEVA